MKKRTAVVVEDVVVLSEHGSNMYNLGCVRKSDLMAEIATVAKKGQVVTWDDEHEGWMTRDGNGVGEEFVKER